MSMSMAAATCGIDGHERGMCTCTLCAAALAAASALAIPTNWKARKRRRWDPRVAVHVLPR